jgi:DNA repair ATPase RecN
MLAAMMENHKRRSKTMMDYAQIDATFTICGGFQRNGQSLDVQTERVARALKKALDDALFDISQEIEKDDVDLDCVDSEFKVDVQLERYHRAGMTPLAYTFKAESFQVES